MCAPGDQKKSNGDQRRQVELDGPRCQRWVDVSGGSDLLCQAENLRRSIYPVHENVVEKTPRGEYWADRMPAL
jgi:hypothetical protein